MIQGIVINLQARVNVEFRLPGQPHFALKFVVDSGFEEALTLPPDVVSALNLPFFQEIDANLADNSDIKTDVFIATIQ